jgi:heme/copper-type cytochrome/quinol oxidase subunit 2
MALSPGLGLAVLALAYVAMFVMSIMLTIQRSHDFNMTGWFSLLVFVPFANLLFWFVPGTDGANRFGAKTQPNSTGVTVALWIVPVVFVIGIVAAVSIPAYQDYVKRAQVQQQR